MKELKISGRNTNITVKKLNGDRTKESFVIGGLKVANATKFNTDGKWIRLLKTYSKEKLTIGGGSFTSKQMQKWTYLDKIQGEICLSKDVNIRILIGANCPEALEPVKVINSENNGPCTWMVYCGFSEEQPSKKEILL